MTSFDKNGCDHLSALICPPGLASDTFSPAEEYFGFTKGRTWRLAIICAKKQAGSGNAGRQWG
jgi:hypothetical protein